MYFFLGTSRDVTLGPTAIMSLLVSFYTFHEPAYAVLLAFLSGCIQLAMGFLRLGKTVGPSCQGVPRHLPPGDALALSLSIFASKGLFLCVCEGGGVLLSPPLFCLEAKTLGEVSRASDPTLPSPLSKPVQTGCVVQQCLAPVPPDHLSQPISTHVLWDWWSQLSIPSWLARLSAGLHLLPHHQGFHIRCHHHHRLRADQGRHASWRPGPSWVVGPRLASLRVGQFMFCSSRAQSTRCSSGSPSIPGALGGDAG